MKKMYKIFLIKFVTLNALKLKFRFFKKVYILKKLSIIMDHCETLYVFLFFRIV